MVLRIVGGVLGTVGGASAMSAYQIRDAKFDFGNFTRHIATPSGLFGAVMGGATGFMTGMVAEGFLGMEYFY